MKLVVKILKSKYKQNQKPKENNDRSRRLPDTVHSTKQILGVTNNQKRLKAKPSIITIYRCTRVIISEKRVRFVFGQSRGSSSVFLTWFQPVPVFDSKRTGYNRFWLLPYFFCFCWFLCRLMYTRYQVREWINTINVLISPFCWFPFGPLLMISFLLISCPRYVLLRSNSCLLYTSDAADE